MVDITNVRYRLILDFTALAAHGTVVAGLLAILVYCLVATRQPMVQS
jgi:hypothetical protein